MWKKIDHYVGSLLCWFGLHDPTTRMEEHRNPTRDEIIAAKHGEEIYMGPYCKHCKRKLNKS